MERFLSAVLDAKGGPMTGVTITVKDVVTGANASLWSDDGITTKANPFTNDANGSFEFYARNGRYHVELAKALATFVAADSQDLVLWDPRDDGDYSRFLVDFMAMQGGGQQLIDGYRFSAAGNFAQKTGTTTYKNGWVDAAETAGVAGSGELITDTAAFALNWAVTAQPLLVDCLVQKLGTAVAGTRRIGLATQAFAGADRDGIYLRQVDANNAFLVARASSVESTLDLGQTLNNITQVRWAAKTGEVRGWVDDVHKGTITSNIPSTILGLSIHGGAISSAAGLSVGHIIIWAKR